MEQTLRRARAFLSAKVATTPMFGHHSVAFDVHLRALMGSALFVSTLTALFVVAVLVVDMVLGATPSSGPSGVNMLFWFGMAGWIATFITVVPVAGFMFSVTRMILGLIKQNFGWAYVMVGALSGTLAATSEYPGSPHHLTPKTLIFYTVVGLLTGVAYWTFVCRRSPAAALDSSASLLPTTDDR